MLKKVDVYTKKRRMAQRPKNKLEAAVATSASKAKKKQKQHFLFGRIYFYIRDNLLSEEIDIPNLISLLEENYPAHLFEEVDAILIGRFEELEERDLEAMYQDAAIYISSGLQTTHDYLENIVHELAQVLKYMKIDILIKNSWGKGRD